MRQSDGAKTLRPSSRRRTGTMPGSLKNVKPPGASTRRPRASARSPEKALRDSEPHFREIVETANEGIAIDDPDGVIAYVNQRMADMLGYSRAEILGRSSLEFVDEEERKDVLRTRDLLKSGAGLVKERKFRRKDGSTLWTLSNISLQRDRDGRFIGYLGMHTDISDHKRAEEALRDSEANLKSLAENVPCVLMRFDRQLRVVYLNRQSDRYNPNPVARMTGRTNREMGMPEHLCDLWDAAIERVFNTGIPEEMEFDFAGPPGMRTFTLKFAPEFGPDGTVHYVLGFSSDITERKQAEKDLRESESRYRGLVQQANSAIIRWKIDGTLTFVNDYAESFFGYRAEEIIGRHVGILVAPSETSGDRVSLVESIVAHPERHLQNINENICRDGRRVWMAWTNTPILDPQGRVAEILAVGTDITNRIKAEEALRVSEERFRIAVMNSNLSFAQFDRDAKFTWIHHPHPDFESHKGKRSDEVSDCDGTRRMTALRRELLETGKGVRAELSFDLSDGVHVYDTISEPIFDEAGAVVGGATVSLDITERKKIEVQLRESDQNYRALFNNRTVALARCQTVFDDQGQPVNYVVLDVNAAWLQQSGTRSEDVVGRRITEAFPGVSQDLIDRHNRVAVTGQDSHFEIYEPSIDTWFDVNVFSPRKGYFVTLSYNITERKRAEEALHKSEERFRKIFENASIGMLIADADRRYHAVNDRFCEMMGRSRDELLASGCGNLLHPDDQAGDIENVGRLLRGEVSAFTSEMRYIRSDGAIVWVRVNVSRLPGREEDRPRLIATMEDITERKQAEDALRNSDRQKNEFIAVLSHELRNPMAAIRTGLSILEQVPQGGEEARQTTAMVDRQFSHLTRLVDDLLDVTRIVRNKIMLKKERLELNDLLRRVLQDCREGVEAKGLDLRVELDDAPVELWGDRTRISQVFANLLENAIDFTPPGGRIEVKGERDERGRRAVIRVSDTGIGISPEMLSRLFNPFVQADTSLTRSGSGLGLGLALVKGLVELHGGEVGVASPGPGRGSEFTVRIPLGGEAGQGPAAAPPASAPRRRILLIEDNKDIAQSLGKLLGLLGHEATVALTGSEGLRLARRDHPDVVLCDIGLPDIDGYEVGRRLRSDRSLEGALLVALTGYAQPEDLERASAAGFDRHLAKPIELQVLKKVLAEL